MASLLDATRSLWASVLNGGAARKPSSPATADRPSRLKFAEPCATTHAVEPAPRELRDEVWWTARDYAEIRQKQRALALEALRQARAAPAGTTPPPIPGESRRGLGVCCEPGTTAERARLVQEGRAEVVRAHRGGKAHEERTRTRAQQRCGHTHEVAARRVSQHHHALVPPRRLGPR